MESVHTSSLRTPVFILSSKPSGCCWTSITGLRGTHWACRLVNAAASNNALAVIVLIPGMTFQFLEEFTIELRLVQGGRIRIHIPDASHSWNHGAHGRMGHTKTQRDFGQCCVNALQFLLQRIDVFHDFLLPISPEIKRPKLVRFEL